MNHTTKIIDVRDLNQIAYDEALRLQHTLIRQRQNDAIPDTLLLLEHPAVITLGRRADVTDVLVDPADLRRRGIDIHRIERGGEVTYHGPGQLVGYLIIHLYERHRRLRQFIHNVEETCIRMLHDNYAIEAGRHQHHRGVWVGNEKIAAIGITVTGGVTMHGFALNVNVDLRPFGWIVPCGIRDLGQTSMQKVLGHSVPMADIKRAIVHHFENIFDYRLHVA